MKIKYVLIGIINLLLTDQCYSVNPVDAGARSNGTGNANTTQIDLFSLFNNQSASAFLEKKEVGVFSENRYITHELTTFGFLAALPTKLGTLGFSLSRFGYSSFNQTLLGASFGKKLSRDFSLGLRINYFDTQIRGFESKGIVYGELSLLSKVTDKITLGAHILNPTRPELGEARNQKTPAVFKVGVSYGEQEHYRLFFDLNKNIEEDFNAKVGVEYFLLNALALRAGVNTEPSQFFGGIGVNREQLAIDFSTAYLNNLGFTPSISVNYAF